AAPLRSEDRWQDAVHLGLRPRWTPRRHDAAFPGRVAIVARDSRASPPRRAGRQRVALQPDRAQADPGGRGVTRYVRIGGAVLCLAAAVFLLLFAVEARDWGKRIASDDLRFAGDPSSRSLWHPTEVAPYGLARNVLGI